MIVRLEMSVSGTKTSAWDEAARFSYSTGLIVSFSLPGMFGLPAAEGQSRRKKWLTAGSLNIAAALAPLLRVGDRRHGARNDAGHGGHGGPHGGRRRTRHHRHTETAKQGRHCNCVWWHRKK